MKTKLLTLIVALTFSAGIITADPLGTTFTYQARLAEGGTPASGDYDLQFTLYADASGGSAVAGPITNAAVAVSNGLFTATLDFGAGVFTGDARWLEIAVRTNGGGAFTPLTPRQPLTPAPYALYGANAGSANTLSGVLLNSSLVGTYSQPLTFNNVGNSFTGNGAALTGVNAALLGGQNGAFYQNAGNLSGTLPTSVIADNSITAAKLSANVALRAGGNAFTGNQTVNSGSLGIGITSPTRQLQSTETTTGSLTYPFKISNEGDTTNTAVGMLFQTDGGGDRGKGAVVYERTGTWNRGSFHFLQNSTANASVAGRADAVMTIANNGDVGIGTTSPQARLHVVGDVQVNGNLAYGGLGGLNWGQTNAYIAVLAGQSKTLQEFGVLKPAAGFLVIMATVNVFVYGDFYVRLKDVTSGETLLTSCQGDAGAVAPNPLLQTLQITWVVPVSAGGYINLRLDGVAGLDADYVRASNMTAMFFPRQLN